MRLSINLYMYTLIDINRKSADTIFTASVKMSDSV